MNASEDQTSTDTQVLVLLYTQYTTHNITAIYGASYNPVLRIAETNVVIWYIYIKDSYTHIFIDDYLACTHNYTNGEMIT